MMADAQGHPKLGLALSGGGFRAALYHVGVLARLADEGRLGRVDVISTVSGGSIVGALYYLFVRDLIRSKADDGKRHIKKSQHHISDEDFSDIVARVEATLLRAAETNLRSRTVANPWAVLRMSLTRYSRTDRLADLLDQELFGPILREGDSLELRKLAIGTTEDPPGGRSARWYRAPELLLNTTCLNTGRNWRFETGQMGEPELDRTRDCIDVSVRLERPPAYEELPRDLRGITIGQAVAASAAVPALFPPMSISTLYGQWVDLQLVDGGVCDNQGIQGLLDAGCDDFLLSDASGQMEADREPATSAFGVIARSNSVLMERLRQEQLIRILSLEEKRVAMLHLRRGIAAELWKLKKPGEKGTILRLFKPLGRLFPSLRTPYERSRVGSAPRELNVAMDVQDALSRIRTDLDAFSEVEAWALMVNGYQQAKHFAGRYLGAAPRAGRTTRKWRFLSVEPYLREGDERFLEHLRQGRKRAFKVPQGMTQKIATYLIWFSIGAALLVTSMRVSQRLDVGTILEARANMGWASVAVLVALPWLLLLILQADRLPKTIEQLGLSFTLFRRLANVLIGIFTFLLVMPAAFFHLYVTNRLYVEGGRFASLKRPP